MGELEPWIDENFIRNVWYQMGEQVNVKMIRDKFSGYDPLPSPPPSPVYDLDITYHTRVSFLGLTLVLIEPTPDTALLTLQPPLPLQRPSPLTVPRCQIPSDPSNLTGLLVAVWPIAGAYLVF